MHLTTKCSKHFQKRYCRSHDPYTQLSTIMIPIVPNYCVWPLCLTIVPSDMLLNFIHCKPEIKDESSSTLTVSIACAILIAGVSPTVSVSIVATPVVIPVNYSIQISQVSCKHSYIVNQIQCISLACLLYLVFLVSPF